MSVSLSRFQIIEGNPPNLPHKCTICGSISGTFIDFQLDLEYYGTVYFCVENCFTQLANELGYRSPAQHNVVLQSNAVLREELNETLDKVTRLENAVDTLRHLDGGDNGSNGVASYDESKRESHHHSTPETKSGPTKSTSKSGSSDVFNDDGLSELLGTTE